MLVVAVNGKIDLAVCGDQQPGPVKPRPKPPNFLADLMIKVGVHRNADPPGRAIQPRPVRRPERRAAMHAEEGLKDSNCRSHDS